MNKVLSPPIDQFFSILNNRFNSLIISLDCIGHNKRFIVIHSFFFFYVLKHINLIENCENPVKFTAYLYPILVIMFYII